MNLQEHIRKILEETIIESKGWGNSNKKLEVFTTRPDTIFGVNFMVLAPEHELVDTITTADKKVEVEVRLLCI